MVPIAAHLKPIAFLTLLTSLSALIMHAYSVSETIHPSFDRLVSGNFTSSTAGSAFHGLSLSSVISVLGSTPNYALENGALLLLGLIFAIVIVRTLAQTARLLCTLLDKLRYSVLVKHDVFHGMMVASELWPKESKHFRAPTFEDTATLITAHLEGLTRDTALHLNLLSVMTDMLSEMSFARDRLDTFNEDLGNIRRWHALASRRMTACEITHAHLTPTRERFCHGLLIVRARLSHTTREARREALSTLGFVTFTAHRSLLAYVGALIEQAVLWRYSFRNAQSYMAARVDAPRTILERLREQLSSIPEMVDEVALRLEQAVRDLPAESESATTTTALDASSVTDAEPAIINYDRSPTSTTASEHIPSKDTEDSAPSRAGSVRFKQSPARGRIRGAT